jgi:hypothetical protein
MWLNRAKCFCSEKLNASVRGCLFNFEHFRTLLIHFAVSAQETGGPWMALSMARNLMGLLDGPVDAGAPTADNMDEGFAARC